MTDLTTFLASLRNRALGLPAGDLVEHVTREQLLALLDVVEAARHVDKMSGRAWTKLNIALSRLSSLTSKP